ncbi:MAG: protein-L-isoaspartate(D-aspartate) O-methyltransferase [Acidobacteria bacterium]|nr:protein-L-isoaspartate(D-aspartate) O-methyltransferase [Acidobacteriota bacterium]
MKAYNQQRAEMVSRQLRGRGIRDQRVLQAMLEVPRHEFVAPEFRHQAYDDRPLPIGAGQTISQPYMVAIMTESLGLRGHEKVLEIGTGSGYQAAVLARLAARVYTIERERELVDTARGILGRLAEAGLLELSRLELIEGDGTEGYAAAAPYDGILVAAAAPSVPRALEEQLAEGGRLVIPVGNLDYQQLRLIRRVSGQLAASVVNECRFVPLVGRHGWPA